jgi:hypothetical protein
MKIDYFEPPNPAALQPNPETPQNGTLIEYF